MTLLRDIQDLASSGDTRTTDLLRKCKILAARLQSKEFGDWVDRELNGYSAEDDLPNYRHLSHADIKGHFVGPFGTSAKNAPIPLECLPKFARDQYDGVNFYNALSGYEHLLFGGNEPTFRTSIPAGLVVSFADDVYENMTCLQAWQEIPRGALVIILDAVKNRVLGFALDIEKENPQAGEADVSSDSVPVPKPVVSTVFNQHFHGSVGNVASGSQNFDQTATVNHQSISLDFVKLSAELRVLREALLREAVDPEHFVAVGAIRSAEVEADKKDGPRLLENLSKAGTWALSAATSIGTKVAAEAIAQSLGMPGLTG